MPSARSAVEVTADRAAQSYLFLEIGEFGFANDRLGARTSDTSLNVPQCWHS
jgi:hypothetical protein